MSSHDEQVLELNRAAERDALTMRILLKDAEAPIETTLFHAQQALEKGLKAVLVSRNIVFPRTHDLLALFDLLEQHGITVPVARDLFARLGPYAVEFRYLGVIAPEVDRREAAEGVATLLAWAKETLA